MSRPPPGTKARRIVNQFQYVNFIQNHTGAFLSQSATDNQVYAYGGSVGGSVGGSSFPMGRQTELDPLALLVFETTPQAYHNSETRQRSPRCDLDTCRSWQPIRNEIHQLLTHPIESDELSANSKPILLLTGYAAGGKSAFLQTVADIYHGTDQLQSGHFYESVPDIAQRTAGALLANIAYRCYLSESDSVGLYILEAIRRNPLIFQLSLDERFRELIANPIIRQDGQRNTPPKTSLIVIDGVDQCGREEKERILELVHLFVTTFQSRFVFIISTRIDFDLQCSIAKQQLIPYTTGLALDNLGDQSHDIGIYLKQKFAACRQHHRYKQFIPPLWPNESDIEQIVDKCSGQFWLAVIAASYVIDSGADPMCRLATFMDYLGGARWDISSQDYPFRDMDNLFKSIFEPLPDRIRSDVLSILSFYMLYGVSTRSPGPSVQAMGIILELGLGGVPLRLADVGSIINESREVLGRPLTYLVLPHTTLQDFLRHPSRACELHIDWMTRAPIHISQCLKSLTSKLFHSPSPSPLHFKYSDSILEALSPPPHVLETALNFFYVNQHLVTDLRSDILSHVVSLAIPDIYCLIKSLEDDTEQGKMLNNFIIYFLPSFIVFLDRFKHARTNLHPSDPQSNYAYQFRKHLKDHFDLLQTVAMPLYASDWRLSFKLSLAFVPKKTACRPKPIQECNLDDYQHLMLLFTYFDVIPFAQQYQHSLAFFSASALHCLMHLSNQPTASRVPASPFLEVRRSWRKQGRNPLMDLIWCWKHFSRMYFAQEPKIGDSFRRSIAACSRRNHHLLFSQPVVRAAARSMSKALSRRRQALRRIHFKQYQLALFCLILFLPRAGMSAQLLQLCAILTFSSKSPAFPNLSRKAQEAMSTYVRRWKDYMFVDP